MKQLHNWENINVKATTAVLHLKQVYLEQVWNLELNFDAKRRLIFALHIFPGHDALTAVEWIFHPDLLLIHFRDSGRFFYRCFLSLHVDFNLIPCGNRNDLSPGNKWVVFVVLQISDFQHTVTSNTLSAVFCFIFFFQIFLIFSQWLLVCVDELPFPIAQTWWAFKVNEDFWEKEIADSGRELPTQHS